MVDKFKQAQKRKKNPYDEIERAVLTKVANAPLLKSKALKIADGDVNEDIEPEYDGNYIRRRALVDQMLIKNGNTLFSYADEKRIFYGMGGNDERSDFSSVDLAEWFRVYNQT